MMSVIADHSCQRLTTNIAGRCIFSCTAPQAGYTATGLKKFPACLAFSAQQKRQSGNLTPPFMGCCQVAALS